MKPVVLLLAVVSGCAAHDGQEDVFLSLQANARTVCEVMADPNLYIDRRIIIKGTYFAEPHQRLLIDKTCPESSLRVSHSLRVKGNPKAKAIVEKFRKKHATVRVPVVYSATLTGRAVEIGCTEPSCYDYRLQDAQLLAAFPR